MGFRDEWLLFRLGVRVESSGCGARFKTVRTKEKIGSRVHRLSLEHRLLVAMASISKWLCTKGGP